MTYELCCTESEALEKIEKAWKKLTEEQKQKMNNMYVFVVMLSYEEYIIYNMGGLIVDNHSIGNLVEYVRHGKILKQ